MPQIQSFKDAAKAQTQRPPAAYFDTATATPAQMGKALIWEVSRPLNGHRYNKGLQERAMDLIDAGADLTQRDSKGHTALMWSAYYTRQHVFKALLAQGANPYEKDNSAMTLFDQTRLRRSRLAQTVLARHCDALHQKLINDIRENGMTLQRPIKVRRQPLAFKRSKLC